MQLLDFLREALLNGLEKKGIEESREATTSALGKMAGCLTGSGFVLSIALFFGIKPAFG